MRGFAMTGKIGKSNMATKCTAGVHDIAKDQDNYYEKVNEKWIRCTDLECFKKQGGTYEPGAKPAFKSRSKETRFNDAVQMLALLWPVAVKKADEAYPYPKVETPQDAQNIPLAVLKEIDYNRRILAQVFLKVMTQEYTR